MADDAPGRLGENQRLRLHILQEILRDYRTTAYRLITGHAALVGAVGYFLGDGARVTTMYQRLVVVAALSFIALVFWWWLTGLKRSSDAHARASNDLCEVLGVKAVKSQPECWRMWGPMRVFPLVITACLIAWIFTLPHGAETRGRTCAKETGRFRFEVQRTSVFVLDTCEGTVTLVTPQ